MPRCWEEATLVADLVVVTLPLGVLKTGKVQFLPPLDAKKDVPWLHHLKTV